MGAAAARQFGSVTADGYTPSNAGADGAPGKIGQAGTGGGGPAIAIVAQGIAPVLRATALTPGSGGPVGTGPSGDGAVGESAEVKLIDVPAGDAGGPLVPRGDSVAPRSAQDTVPRASMA